MIATIEAEGCRFSASSFVVLNETRMRGAQTRRQTMRVMVFGKASDNIEESAPPTAEAFAAMDRFTEDLVNAGIMPRNEPSA